MSDCIIFTEADMIMIKLAGCAGADEVDFSEFYVDED